MAKIVNKEYPSMHPIIWIPVPAAFRKKTGHYMFATNNPLALTFELKHVSLECGRKQRYPGEPNGFEAYRCVHITLSTKVSLATPPT